MIQTLHLATETCIDLTWAEWRITSALHRGNADVDGDAELTVDSDWFQRVGAVARNYIRVVSETVRMADGSISQATSRDA